MTDEQNAAALTDDGSDERESKKADDTTTMDFAKNIEKVKEVGFFINSPKLFLSH